jgi:hypothetical protein
MIDTLNYSGCEINDLDHYDTSGHLILAKHHPAIIQSYI